jgi:hypothetical protein
MRFMPISCSAKQFDLYFPSLEQKFDAEKLLRAFKNIMFEDVCIFFVSYLCLLRFVG